MPQLVVRALDLAQPVLVDLVPDLTLLLGRAPEPARLGEQGITVRAPVVPVLLPSERVSANHLLVVCAAEGTWLQELGSRNGTWLRLDAGRPIYAPAGQSLTVELAGLAEDTASAEGPAEAAWQQSEEFGAAVLREVQAWLRRQAIVVDVALGRAGDGGDRRAFPLADGSALALGPGARGTLGVRWPQVLEQLQSYIAEQNARLELERGHEEDLVLASPALRAAHRKVAEAAARELRVMLLGPTGSGKERLARCYHRHGRRPDGPFKAVNCAQLTEHLVHAQLFGAKRGAFTGCVEDLVGAVEWAANGTLFLDEVGEMGLEAQRALLRFLSQKGEYERLGDPRPRVTRNVQIVCATNVDIHQAMAAGRFREDLWYRLAGKVVHVPPLRERQDDILAYLRGRRLASGVTALEALAPAALQVVLADPWPGNFRDLENFVDRLPAGLRPGGLGARACHELLAEGRAYLPPRTVEAPPPRGVDPSGWQALVDDASRAFSQDQGGPPRSWGQLEGFMEKYLKPVFVAHALGLQEHSGQGLNFSALARQLHIADGTTVKTHLRRFRERFRRDGP